MEKEEDDVGKGNWFCSRDCEEMFFSLHELLGKTIDVAPPNLTWTLLKAVKRDGSGEYYLILDGVEFLIQNESKMSKTGLWKKRRWVTVVIEMITFVCRLSLRW